jgi:TPM domain
MRTARLVAAILTILTSLFGGLLLAPPAGAQPPFRLSHFVTDNAGLLTDSGRAAVTSAIDKLYADRHIRLWVVYVDDFSGQSPENWAKRTISISDLGGHDAVLAVSATERAYAFLVPSAITSVNASQVDGLRRNKIEPPLRDGDWSGAAVAAANGLNASPQSPDRVILPVALGVIVVGVVVLLVATRYRRRRRRAAALAAARRIDPTDAAALAAVPLEALDDLSRSMVVEVDNAVRTSSNELTLAIDEFGKERTQPFTGAVDNAKAALAQAFTLRQQLEDATPETPAQRRELLTRVIVSAARADRELESQTEAFEKLRDLVINAPSRLDALTRQYIELTSRIAPAEQRMAELHKEFDDAALSSVSGNVTGAKERLAFADRNIGTARDLASDAESGKQTGLVDAFHAAESALGQALSLLDAVDTAAGDIRHAIATLPSAMAGIQASINRANEQLKQTPKTRSPRVKDLTAARDAAVTAAESARGRGSIDPLGAFAKLTSADAELTRRLAALAEERATAEQLNRSYEQALFTAESRVRAVSEYIDTRRGSIGPEARTRLAEAKRQLQAAHDKRTTNLLEATAYANGASAWAAYAQSLANADVQSAQRAYSRRRGGSGGNDTGALIGGIIISDLLRGGMRGGLGGGWIPTSFGGSSSSSGRSSDGGLMGGGGRF